MNGAMNYNANLDDESRAALLNALAAECVPEGHNGIKSAGLHDEDGVEVGTLFYNMAIEEFTGTRILYVDPVYVHASSGCSRPLAGIIASEYLDAAITQALKVGAQVVTYVTCGVAPADADYDMKRLWKSLDTRLRELARWSPRVFHLEELPARKERARAVIARSVAGVDPLE